MLSKIQAKSDKIPKIRLSLLMGGGVFLLLILFSAAMLAVTYVNSQLIVENDRKQLHKKSDTISSLVIETRLDTLKHAVDLISEDRNFNISHSEENAKQQLSYLATAFYTQRQNTIDMLALISTEGKILGELSSETVEFSWFQQDISRASGEHGTWYWSSQKGTKNQPAQMLVYYKREVLNSATGRLEGYLVGGLSVNGNRKLIGEIRKRTGAEYVALMQNNEILSAIGETPVGLNNKFYGDQFLESTGDNKNSIVFSSLLLEQQLQNAGFGIITSYPAAAQQSLERFLFLSVGMALLLALLLSAIAALFGKVLYLNPLLNLVGYARSMEHEEKNPEVPETGIIEFDEMGQSLEHVFSAFHESDKRFQDFVSVSSDSIWETDENDRYVFFSRNLNLDITLEFNQIIGNKRWELEGVDQEYGDWEGHWKNLSNHEPFRNFVYRRQEKTGRMLYWSASGKPRYDANGDYKGYRGSSSNITSQMGEKLEAEKMNEVLQQSQKLELVGQLTGGVAHDFNNLLSVVIGNLELISEKTSLDDTLQKHLSDAIRGAERGAALTHQLLAYSRQQSLKPITVQPKHVIWEMSSKLERALGDTIKLKMKLQDTWSVLIDPAELENALFNLTVNARDAMPSGELNVESFDIQLDQEYTNTVSGLKAGDYVCVTITDTGEGIPEENLEHIMEPFFTTKEVGKGSGLGLSMVFGFAKQSGGHLGIYSEAGHGTSVQLFLPRAFVAKDQDVLPSKQEIKHGNGELVLVVEDNVQVRKLVVSQLKSIGYTTMECADGPTAFSVLEKETVDILLSDVVLPLGLNGLDIIHFAEEQHASMPKVLMSGFTGNTIRNQDDIPDHVEILYKPFTKIRLAEAIDYAKKQRLKPVVSASIE